MEQYISKSAVVAEIEKIIADETESIKSFEHGKNVSEVQRSNARIGVLTHLCSLLDTLETKEVDLESLVEDFCYEYDNRKEKWYELCPNDRKLLSNPTLANFAMSIAKHFYELGLKAKKGE